MGGSEVYSRLASARKCPVCGGELEAVYFSGYRRIPGFKPYLYKNLPALRCGNCRIAILDYERNGIYFGKFVKKCVNCGKEIPIASEVCPHCGAEQPEYRDLQKKR